MIAAQSEKPSKRSYHPHSLLNMLISNPLTTLSLLLPLVSTALVFFSAPAAALQKSKLTVLPLPTHSTTGDTPLCLASDFRISAENHAIPHDLAAAMARTEKALWISNHRYLSVERGSEFFSRSNSIDLNPCKHHLSSLVLSLKGSNLDETKSIPSIFESAVRPAEERAELEAYRLFVPLNGPARIEAKTALGLFRGLSTFEQLFYHLPAKSAAAGSEKTVLSRPDTLAQSEQLPLGSGSGSSRETAGQAQGPAESTETTGRTYAPFAPYEIEDKPSFGWRAVMLDTSRHYFGLPSILKVSHESFRKIPS